MTAILYAKSRDCILCSSRLIYPVYRNVVLDLLRSSFSFRSAGEAGISPLLKVFGSWRLAMASLL